MAARKAACLLNPVQYAANDLAPGLLHNLVLRDKGLRGFPAHFSPRHEQSPQQGVALRWPDQRLETVGMVTRQSLADLPDGLLRGDRVAVYLPMGYMIGGYTVFVPRDWVHPIDMSVEEAMRQSLIAWMAMGPKASAHPTVTAEPGPRP